MNPSATCVYAATDVADFDRAASRFATLRNPAIPAPVDVSIRDFRRGVWTRDVEFATFLSETPESATSVAASECVTHETSTLGFTTFASANAATDVADFDRAASRFATLRNPAIPAPVDV